MREEGDRIIRVRTWKRKGDMRKGRRGGGITRVRTWKREGGE